jgi:PhzF family phenazine biosynthesis protein
MGEASKIPTYIVDAFTDQKFKGNPACVCLLNRSLDDSEMQNIATEMNLSETAFLSPKAEKPIIESIEFNLRWFTPKVEVPLCGHATLATSAVLFNEIGISSDEISYETLSGTLTAKKEEEGILLNFPSNEPEPVSPPLELLEAMGISEFEDVTLAKDAKKLLVHLKNGDSLRTLNPDFEKMMRANMHEDIIGVIATSSGSPQFDFMSRFFAPWVGINEDPVTGAAHTVLAPYWSKILNKRKMSAYQASERGGKLIVRLGTDNRVDLIGNAVMVSKGELYL